MQRSDFTSVDGANADDGELSAQHGISVTIAVAAGKLDGPCAGQSGRALEGHVTLDGIDALKLFNLFIPLTRSILANWFSRHAIALHRIIVQRNRLLRSGFSKP